MLRSVLILLVIPAFLVILLASSGYQRRVDIGQGDVIPSDVGKIQMDRDKPSTPFDATAVTPSFFDYVRYAMVGGPFSATEEPLAAGDDVQTIEPTEEEAERADREYGIDIDRSGMRIIQSRRNRSGTSGGVDASRVRSADSTRARANSRTLLRRKAIAARNYPRGWPYYAPVRRYYLPSTR